MNGRQKTVDSSVHDTRAGRQKTESSPRRLSGQGYPRSAPYTSREQAFSPLCCSSRARRSSLLALLSSQHPAAFTLFELLASMGILAVLSALLFAAFNQATKAWVQGESRVETFTQARAALDFMARELSQAIVTNNIPFVAVEDDSVKLNTTILPQGNLAFIATVGDATKDGMDLIEVVYRLSKKSTVGTDRSGVFTNTGAGLPYRLVRRVSPYSSTGNYDYGQNQTNATTTAWDFYTPAHAANWMETGGLGGTQVLAENVVSLTFQFQDAKGNLTVDTTYKKPFWNSTGSAAWQTELGSPGVPLPSNVKGPALSTDMQGHAPALVVITFTMLDSRAAARYNAAASNPAAQQAVLRESQRVFTTSVAIPNH